MYTMQPTLLIGPADWDPARLPREEYSRRLEQVWADWPDAGGAIVYGDPQDHAALAYLTHFTPKLEPAIALLPKEGEPRLLVGGGANMIGAARPLTFIQNMAALRDMGTVVAEWARGLPAGASVLSLNIDAMTSSMHQAVLVGSQGHSITNADLQLATRMRVKTARELDLMRAGGARLSHGVDALREAFQQGESATGCVLQAEHVLHNSGAQDVRTLFSTDRGRTLRPFVNTIAGKTDPMPVYLAVRYDGYWTEAFCSLHSDDGDLVSHAESIISALLANIRPGARLSALCERAESLRGSYDWHPLTAHDVVRPIGLSLQESPVSAGSAQVMVPGETYAVQIGLIDSDHGAFASAVVVVTDRGSELLSSSR